MLTSLTSLRIISSSSYSDSSSELLSSSSELVSVGVEGLLLAARLSPSRRLPTLLDPVLAAWLVPL